MRHRLEQFGVDAHRHEAHAVVAHAHVGVDVFDAVLADHDDAWHATGNTALHLDEVVPTTDAATLAGLLGVLHLERPVACDRVVQRDDGGQLLLDGEYAVTETLVVVHQIEVAQSGLELFVDAHAEPAEGALQVGEGLGQVALRLHFPVRGQAARVVVVPEVEAGQLVQRDAGIEHRVGLAAEHLDGVAEIDQRFGEVTGVHALPAHVRLPAVGEIGDLQRRVGIESLRASRGYGGHGSQGYRPMVTGRYPTGAAHTSQRMVKWRCSRSPGSRRVAPPIENASGGPL